MLAKCLGDECRGPQNRLFHLVRMDHCLENFPTHKSRDAIDMKDMIRTTVRQTIPAPVLQWLRSQRARRSGGELRLPLGTVRFGDLRRVTPIDDNFGTERGGRPVDRHYIEKFLARHADDVRGRVLEVGVNSYTRQFGGDRVTRGDILHVDENDPDATISADLTDADHVPSDTFDCFIFTQTLHLIFDLEAAVKTVRRILKPGGVVLTTVPGISQIDRHDWGSSWYWGFTNASARRLFERVFPAANVEVEAFGNVLTAISFLHGITKEELSQHELDYRDPCYDLTIGIRAVKPVQ